MDQSLHAWREFHERSKIGDPADRTLDAFAHLVFARYRMPRMRRELLHSDGNAPLLGINLQDLGFKQLADREHVGRIVDPAPGNVTDMQQRVYAANVNKGSIIGQAAYSARHRVALFELGV